MLDTAERSRKHSAASRGDTARACVSQLTFTRLVARAAFTSHGVASDPGGRGAMQTAEGAVANRTVAAVASQKGCAPSVPGGTSRGGGCSPTEKFPRSRARLNRERLGSSSD